MEFKTETNTYEYMQIDSSPNISYVQRDIHTNRQTDMQIDRQTDRETKISLQVLRLYTSKKKKLLKGHFTKHL